VRFKPKMVNTASVIMKENTGHDCYMV
jgi:hypothetical protein